MSDPYSNPIPSSPKAREQELANQLRQIEKRDWWVWGYSIFVILPLTFVVIVIGGIGSIRGAFMGALLVGVIDTFGRVLLPPALASMTIYILMAVVLYWRPQGLFPTAV